MGVVYGSRYINQTLETCDKALFFLSTAGFYCLPKLQRIGQLIVTGHEETNTKQSVVFLNFTMESVSVIEKSANESRADIDNALDVLYGRGTTEPISNINKTDQPKYSTLPDLSTCTGQTMTVLAYGKQSFHGVTRGIIKLCDGRIYRAGRDVDSKMHLLHKGSSVNVIRRRIDPKSRRPYAIVEILEAGDWSFGVYAKLPFVNTLKTGRVMATKEIDVKGVNRKIILLDSGNVYKCRKGKLEEQMKPGYVLG